MAVMHLVHVLAAACMCNDWRLAVRLLPLSVALCCVDQPASQAREEQGKNLIQNQESPSIRFAIQVSWTISSHPLSLFLLLLLLLLFSPPHYYHYSIWLIPRISASQLFHALISSSLSLSFFLPTLTYPPHSFTHSTHTQEP